MMAIHPLDLQTRPAGGFVQAANGNGANSRPPTRLVGYVEDSAWDGILADVLELVPDCQWPTNIQTYQSMRRDAKLSAILDGYGLQLRRAQWQLDGTDCRPEVVQLVADDLGLPVKGEDKHGAARTRGVSWHEHLRSALSVLPFGHAGFELQAEIVDGRARLVGLWDRPQHTIHTIHVRPQTGEFNGISQDFGKVTWDEPEIRPDRLAWYAHQREGAQWFGVSLIRPAFAPWLLKREMQRVLATSSRRFGMGVPTVKWAQTATPTPQQFSEGQRAATAARVGDQSGLSLPPGAALELVGMSGGVPDTLGFIKWLDQQMSVSALMGHLDLGQTQTGSRALGESFIDAWTLALEAIGEEIADVATRQVIARIVAWNWGADEPVPRVTVSGIGSRREVTAQSLQLLLDSGALAADPALEEWVRREYRLPARTTPRPTQVQVPARPGPARPAVAAAAREPKALPAAPARAANQPPPPATAWEQPELPITAQAEGQPEPTDEVEQAQEDANTALFALLAAWPALAAPAAAALAAGATTAAAGGALVTLDALTVPVRIARAITTAVATSMVDLARSSAGRAQDGIAAQGVDVGTAAVDEALIRRQAQATTELIVAGYRSAAARAAAGMAGADPEQVGEAVHRAADDITDTAGSQQAGQRRGFVAGELDVSLHAAVHWGRVAAFRALEALGVPVVWWADESNEDRNRCKPCFDVHGEEFDTLADALAAYPSGKYRLCDGRWRCRGALRARIVRDRGEVPGA